MAVTREIYRDTHVHTYNSKYSLGWLWLFFCCKREERFLFDYQKPMMENMHSTWMG